MWRRKPEAGRRPKLTDNPMRPAKTGPVSQAALCGAKTRSGLPCKSAPVTRGELARAQQLGEAYRIAPVRLHSIAGLLWNKRGGHHQALVAEALEQSVETISCRPCFVAKRQMTVFRRKLAHELSDRRLRGRELPEIPHLAATAAIGNCHCITQFRRIDSDKCLGMMPHDSPSLFEALPGPSGSPSLQHRG